MNKVVVYTAIFGDSVKLHSQPAVSGIDFICFSDRPHVANGWKVIVCETKFGGDLFRNNRYYKLNPHLFFKEYECSIYMDGNFVILKSPLGFIEQELQSVNLLVFDHNQTETDPRDCIYEEYEAILNIYHQHNLLKDDLDVMKSLINLCRSKGYPTHNGLIAGGVLIRKHNESDVIKMMESWWYFIQHYSKRDQLSFNFLAWEQGFKFGYLPGDIRRGNPWFYLLTKKDNKSNFGLFKNKLKRVIGNFLRLFS